MSACRTLSVIGFALLCAACQVAPNTGETTPPTITVTLTDKLQNQGWTGNQYVIGAGGLVTVKPDLDILITASAVDPGGMNTLTGSLGFFVNACGSVEGGGVFDPLDSFNETAKHNPPNTVSDTLFYVSEVTTAKLKAQPCFTGQTGSSGLGTVVLQATATNQSNISANEAYDIHTVGGVIPQ